MTGILWFLLWMFTLGALAYHKASKYYINSIILSLLALTLILAPFSWFFTPLLITFITFILLPLNYSAQRCLYISAPILKWLQEHAPKISETEKIALETGTTWWDKELFSGNPDWNKLFQMPVTPLSAEEQAFINGPVEKLCKMSDEWDISQRQDLAPKIWKFLKSEKFFGLVIPKQYGGLEFSCLAHSDILTKIASKSLSVATTVAVPNSLGPAELILKYGTEKQKEYYLPRLANGTEIPCFALTGPDAGSDATSIEDLGVICKGDFNGKKIVGVRLNWNKRYITLAPIATLIGLAFKLTDPENLIGDVTNIGITCALIPSNTAGVIIGQRHKPIGAHFQNGPIQGNDVFIPLDWIIGGPAMAGHGWRMLVECLSTGRAISLPASATGITKSLAIATGAYARIRHQFKKPIGQFEGIEEVLARLAGNAYIANAARVVTASCIDQGHSPATLGAIIKYHLTEKARQSSMDAMDVHGGKGIMLGPKNYTAHYYQNAPIFITVEGANILTRSLIIFGQGVMQAHPYILQELAIAKDTENLNAVDKFDEILTKHITYTLNNAARAMWMGIRQVFFTQNHKESINRASSAFAFVSDICLIIYGSKLKIKEKMSGRLADLLSFMYLASCSLKHYEDHGKPEEEKELIEWVMRDCLSCFWHRMDELLNNIPKTWLKIVLRLIVMPCGMRFNKPEDKLGHKVAQYLLSPNPTRESLSQGIYLTPEANNKVGTLDVVLHKIILSENENADSSLAKEANALRSEIISVDHFDAKDF